MLPGFCLYFPGIGQNPGLGAFNFQAGKKKITAGSGELIVLPKGIPQSFNLVTDTAKALLLITLAGLKIIFKEFGTPAQTLDLPPVPGKLPKELFQRLHQRSEELGSIWMPEV
jgi:hypothetical protein